MILVYGLDSVGNLSTINPSGAGTGLGADTKNPSLR